MKIGDLAKATGVSVPTIRLYEKEGLIEGAGRSSGKFRLFSPEHEVRLRFIKSLRHLGFSLDDVRRLLELSPNLSESDLHQSLADMESAAQARVDALTKLISCLGSIRAGEMPLNSVERVFEADRRVMTAIAERHG